MEEMFNSKDISDENREKLWQYYYDRLSSGVDAGYGPKPEFYDAEMANALKYSIAEFSAFKETSFRKDLESLMTDNGKFVPWSEFKKEAFKLSGDYNARWLETEYHQTVANANAAQAWQEFERNADLYPSLRFSTVGDDRVRPEHEVLDGIVRPLNDPFWDTCMPPLDWGCRCFVEQTDEDATGRVPGGVQMKIEFENNPGKTGKIFGGSAYETGLDKTEITQAIENAEKWAEKMYDKAKDEVKIAYEKSILEKPREKQFKQIFESKGTVLQHILYKKGTDHNSILTAAKRFADKGKTAEILPEINRKGFEDFRKKIFPNYSLRKNPDLRIDGVYYDVKEVESFAGFTRNANRAFKQNAIAILDFDGELTPDKMIQIKKRIYEDNNKNQKTGKPFYGKDHFYILNKGKLYKYNRD